MPGRCPAEPLPKPEEPSPEPTFHEFASRWFEAKRSEIRASTARAYEWELTHLLLPYFADHRLSEITTEQVDAYRSRVVRERDALRAKLAANRGQPKTKGRPRRPLSNETINSSIQRLAQILEVAAEYGHIDRNPAAGKRRKLKTQAPRRTYLDRVEQITALLDAAKELDEEARIDRASNRRAMLATLVFAGLRISELLELRWRDLDLAAGRLRVDHSKTDAGAGRLVDLLPVLREELAVYRADARNLDLDNLVFGTAKGNRQNASNVRNRILARSVERANTRLSNAGFAPMPDLSPHSLRRTYISLLLATGAEVPYVMQQVGHADPKVTLGIYAQVMFRGEGERERLRALVNGVEWVQKRPITSSETTSRIIRTGKKEKRPNYQGFFGWARLVSNQRPLACEARH